MGHRFALWDLYKAKETELERAQWSTVVLLKHLETILDMFLESSGIPDAPGQQDLCERQRQVRRQMASIRQLIESTRLPAGHGTDAMASEAVRVDG